MSALSILLVDKSPLVPLSEKGKTTPRRFTCPATGAALTDSTCRYTREATPMVGCMNCLIPLADLPSPNPPCPPYQGCRGDAA